MALISIDLGTTNIKVAAYGDKLEELAIESENVNYLRNDNFVEFNAQEYFNNVKTTILRCCEKAFSSKPYPVSQIILDRPGRITNFGGQGNESINETVFPGWICVQEKNAKS